MRISFRSKKLGKISVKSGYITSVEKGYVKGEDNTCSCDSHSVEWQIRYKNNIMYEGFVCSGCNKKLYKVERK